MQILELTPEIRDIKKSMFGRNIIAQNYWTLFFNEILNQRNYLLGYASEFLIATT